MQRIVAWHALLSFQEEEKAWLDAEGIYWTWCSCWGEET